MASSRKPVRGRRVCKHCPPMARPRPAPYAGPACASCHRDKRKSSRNKAHDTHLRKTYGITREEYLAIKEWQGGTCFICERATGASRNLSVDHCHATGEVRFIACRSCNVMLGHARDSVRFFERAIEVLTDPPVRRALGRARYVPSTGAPTRERPEREEDI